MRLENGEWMIYKQTDGGSLVGQQSQEKWIKFVQSS